MRQQVVVEEAEEKTGEAVMAMFVRQSLDIRGLKTQINCHNEG